MNVLQLLDRIEDSGGYLSVRDGFLRLAGPARLRRDPDVESLLTRCRAHTPLPRCVGFGFGKESDLRRYRGLAEGIIVGSALLTEVLAAPDAASREQRAREFCRGRLAAYKIPARWLFTSSFPLTTTGKIRKDVLSAQLADVPVPAGRDAAAHRTPAEAIQP